MKNFFRKQWFLVISLVIIILAGVVRFYDLGVVPHGMTWDEAAIGYNGHAVWTTRRDEWLVRLPTSFRSFGDYKAPAAIYLSGAFTKLFGLNLWALRLPFALGGVVAVGAMILLVKEWGKVFSWSENEQKAMALLGGVILATSPWHIHYSRTGFESGLSLSLLIIGSYALLAGLAGKKINKFFLSISVLAAVVNVYTYHSAKMVVPLLGFITAWQFRNKIKENWQQVILFVGGGLVLLYPLIKDSLYGKGLERASTLIVAKTDSVLEMITILFSQFAAHFSPLYLIFGETHTLRHGDGRWGVFLIPVFILIVLGFVSIVNQKFRQGWGLAVAWIIVGVLPAALGAELVPHSNRSLLALPGFIILALMGLRYLSAKILQSKLNQKISGSHGEKNMVWVSVMGTLLLWHGLLFVSYLNNYFVNFSRQSSEDFADGYLEAFDYVKQYENDVEKIVFTSDYGQPYIFALFSRKTNPIWYQGGSLVKYEFKDVNAGDLSREKAIVVSSKNDTDLLDKPADKIIYGSDGQVRFKIFKMIY